MSKKKTKKAMTITRERALKLFSYFNYKTAGKWSSKRMEGKLANLPDKIDIKVVNNSKVKAILKEIANASSIEVTSAAKKKSTEDKSVEEKIEKRTGKKAVKKTAKKKVSKKSDKKVAKKKSSKEVDKFGSRKGTIQAQINSVLTKKPKTMDQLLKDAKVKNPQSGHLNNLIQDGWVTKGEKGFALA